MHTLIQAVRDDRDNALEWAFASGECLAVMRYDLGEDFAMAVADAFREAQFRPAPALREIEDMLAVGMDDGYARFVLATDIVSGAISPEDVLYLFRVTARYASLLDEEN